MKLGKMSNLFRLDNIYVSLYEKNSYGDSSGELTVDGSDSAPVEWKWRRLFAWKKAAPKTETRSKNNKKQITPSDIGPPTGTCFSSININRTEGRWSIIKNIIFFFFLKVRFLKLILSRLILRRQAYSFRQSREHLSNSTKRVSQYP